MKILIINGPNLNLLGSREIDVYGNESFESYLVQLQKGFENHEIGYFQSNVEGELINQLQQAAKQYNAVIFNGAGYTHTSVAIADAIAVTPIPVVEVHISNIHARETFRQNSLTAKHTLGVITGFGLSGYQMAVYYLTNILKTT